LRLDRVEPSDEVRRVLERWFAAARDGDSDGFTARLSKDPGSLTIGSDEAEWYRGDAVHQISRAQMADLGGRLPMYERETEAWVEGNVAWAAARVDIRLDGEEIPARATFVLHIEHGDWRIVQYHLSLAVADEEAFGVDLTKSIAAIVEEVQEERPELRSSAKALNGIVTLMFTDVVDSTVINQLLGDRAWLEILREHDRLITTAAESHGGEVVKRMGDGSMLAFPSARRAVSCAVEIRSNIAAAMGGLDPPIRIRMGLHLGEPLRDADDFFGSAVNFAARVSAAAGPGEILVSDVVADVLNQGGDVTLGEGREVELKGFPGRRRVFEVPR
jgi:class 3 adenylate cyclase